MLGGNICSPLVIGERVFVVTGNGRDEQGRLTAPQAPSFVALSARTGKLLWQSNLPGKNIIEGTWSNPVYADTSGRAQVIFAGGDGVLYSFAPDTGKLLWRCDCLPERRKPAEPNGPRRGIDNYLIATPVVVGDRLYVGLGLHPDHNVGTEHSYFLCLDITKKGDVSLRSYDAKATANKESALVWAFGGMIMPAPKKGRSAHFGRTVSTAAVHDGLVYVAEEKGYMHCLDALTGQRCWQHDLKESVLSSPLWVDGRIYLGTDGSMVIYAHGRECKVIATIDMDHPIGSTPTAVNGTLFVASHRRLFAIAPR
jgi:outer membrane protein assembly factor BamB